MTRHGRIHSRNLKAKPIKSSGKRLSIRPDLCLLSPIPVPEDLHIRRESHLSHHVKECRTEQPVDSYFWDTKTEFEPGIFVATIQGRSTEPEIPDAFPQGADRARLVPNEPLKLLFFAALIAEFF
jgi:hypothetical protein